MTKPLDRTKTLDELEGAWHAAPEYTSYLISRCHALHKTPLSQFTVEDLRIMIGQEIGLQFLIPLALQELQSNPLAEGDYYPGDLLANVLAVPPLFWRDRPELRAQLVNILSQLSQVPKELSDAVTRFSQHAL